MPSVIREGERYKTAIAVDLAPTSHSVPSYRGNLLGKYADVYHFGAEVSSYQLNETDKLIIIASHKKPSPHIMLLTHDVDLIHKMPGRKDCSLVADMMVRVQIYITHNQNYPPPLTEWQIKKREIAEKLLEQLKDLLELERQLLPDDFEGREQLRNQIISKILAADHQNYRLANHPFVSRGELGNILYECKHHAEKYEFNPFIAVSSKDQGLYETDGSNCFIWDSVAHLSSTGYSVDDCLQTISNHYQLKQSSRPKQPNRLNHFKQTLETYQREAKDYADYSILPKKPEQTDHEEFSENMSKTFIDPYYIFQSPINTDCVDDVKASEIYALQQNETATQCFQKNNHDTICFSTDKSLIYIKAIDSDGTQSILSYRFYTNQDKIHLLPTLDDLTAVTRASERHLYFPERAWIHFKLFFNHIPAWLNWLLRQTQRIAVEEVYDHIVEQVHRGHKATKKVRPHQHDFYNITNEIEKYLPDDMKFSEWLNKFLDENHYVFTSPSIPETPNLYIDPLHRVFNIAEHAASFFVGMNERNPVIGTVALSAYLIGGLSILASSSLESLLESLHLHGLTYLIPIAKSIGETMSRGKITQAISASMTLWQLTMLTGQLDKASLIALSNIKENPAEIIIVTTLAMSLGYTLCNTIPYLKKEMGDFPYTNYAAVGAKGGAAMYDTIAHPGDDWLLGTIKWILTGVRLVASLLVAPIIEGFYYGWNNGFLNGLNKSKDELDNTLKQILASIIDIPLLMTLFLLKNATALLIHVPFRGLTYLLSKTISLFGHLQDIGNSLISFSSNDFDPISSYRTSPFYGYSNPIKNRHNNSVINVILNSLATAAYFPYFILKDYFALPITDMASYLIRCSLSIANALCKAVSFIMGYIFLGISMITDPTIGRLCLIVSDCITLTANFIDEQAGQLKRQAMSQANIQRGRLYRWAYANETSKLQSNEKPCSPSCQDPIIIDYLDKNMPITTRI